MNRRELAEAMADADAMGWDIAELRAFRRHVFVRGAGFISWPHKPMTLLIGPNAWAVIGRAFPREARTLATGGSVRIPLMHEVSVSEPVGWLLRLWMSFRFGYERGSSSLADAWPEVDWHRAVAVFVTDEEQARAWLAAVELGTLDALYALLPRRVHGTMSA